MKKSKEKIIEKYRILLNLFENYREENIRCLAIISNSNLEGKEVVAKNIAMVLAKSGRKTLFIDCSLSKNSRTKYNNSDNARGFVSVVEAISGSRINGLEIKNCIEKTESDYLSVLELGTNNLEKYSPILKKEYLKRTIDVLKQGFDCIVVDAPSFENLSFTQIITSAADGCMFVLKDKVNELNEARNIKEKLNTMGCKVLGCILEKEKKPTKLFKDKYNDFFRTDNKTKKIVESANSSVSPNI
ncbi:CpsD/CapB family tyrosine-protein kinase [Clostridium oryzae]|uniref:non-specific protein-tyrosine kinase n=1 Tax=Clostridium oryzae TaxID=1450648 RepID=A0A1V4ITA1_9CLOT|nr:CpsD/CapB family tyrosine-protein kinase [Clostridium oryzae]OPJ62697.1 tyrosine-protein kinase YwqD [Clostridium oryzae]